ncbi:glutamate-rich protein 5 [Ctenodactylus gundi]
MGCSSSALNKASDSSRGRSEESESCVAQPKPCTPGRESTFYGNIQRGGLPPLEKPKASVMPTANGVKSCHEPSLAKETAPTKDATDKSDKSGPTEKAQPLEGSEECKPSQPDGKDDTPRLEEKKKDVETVAEAQSVKGNGHTEPVPLGTEAKGQPLRMTGERGSSEAGEGMENPPGAAENIPPGEAGREPQPQEALARDTQPQLLETIPKGDTFPEILEGTQFVEGVEEKQLQATLGKEEQEQPQLLETGPHEKEPPAVLDGGQGVEASSVPQLQERLGKDGQEQPQPLETIPKESITPAILDKSQSVLTTARSDSTQETPEGPGNMQHIQPEGVAGGMEQPAGIAEMQGNVEMARKTHTNEEAQHTHGETREKVETEMENEKVSEGAETKEEETGEGVDLSAAS